MSRPARSASSTAARVVEVDDAAPTRTVLDWLREDARCTGTKEGCNEGDCGACTVVIGELAPRRRDAERRVARPAPAHASTPASSSCRRSTARRCSRSRTCTAPSGALHPVQQAMVECHGSQCGFCTPGFVMSLWAAYEHHGARGTRPTRQQLADELSGNLCRCTGYRPILDAGERMFDLPAGAARHARRSRPRSQSLRADGAARATPHGGAEFIAPRTLDELRRRARWPSPQARLLAGSTDIGLWVNKQFRDLPRHASTSATSPS